jgi:hypothetical protein
MFDRSTYVPISSEVTAEEIGSWTQECRQQTDGTGLRVGNRAEFTLVAPVIQPDGPAIFRESVKKAQVEPATGRAAWERFTTCASIDRR